MEQTWKCSGNDLRKMPLQIWEEDLSILSNAEASNPGSAVLVKRHFMCLFLFTGKKTAFL